jgi:hypothetical protein
VRERRAKRKSGAQHTEQTADVHSTPDLRAVIFTLRAYPIEGLGARRLTAGVMPCAIRLLLIPKGSAGF